MIFISLLIAKITEALLGAERATLIRTNREWKQWVDALKPEILENIKDASTDTKRQIFKIYVRRVEIEIHAKCNRNCPFCTNTIVNRAESKKITNLGMLHSLYSELGSINYSGQILVARYSEPMAFLENLCTQISQMRKIVPHAELAITTNTDYLTKASLDKLFKAGLNVLYMSIYLKEKEEWTPALALKYNLDLAKKLEISITRKLQTPDQLFCTFKYKKQELRSHCTNWRQYGNDRGGMINKYSTLRIGPCLEPFETFVIDHTGAVMPCCNLRSDLPQHQDYIVGNLMEKDISIFDIYSEKLFVWRRALANFDKKSAPCTYCRHRDIPSSLRYKISDYLVNHLNKKGFDLQE